MVALPFYCLSKRFAKVTHRSAPSMPIALTGTFVSICVGAIAANSRDPAHSWSKGRYQHPL